MKRMILFILVAFSVIELQAQGIDKPQYEIITRRAGNYLGTINIELFPLIAPLHVHMFDSLTSEQFFDSTAFHRVVPGFVIQGGDPNSISGPISTWGQGQPWQPTVPAEFNVVRHLRGIIGAARDNDPNSANSQFYICVANSTFLDGNYTVFGQVTSGMNIVDSIVLSPRDANDVPLQKIDMFVSYTGVNDSIPDAPTLTAPADGASGVLNTQSFVWSAVPGAVMYTIELSTDPAFSTIDISKNAGTNSAIITNLGGFTNYFWRVKSNNGGHESIPSNVYNFTSATAAATLTYPADTATGIPLNPVFSWTPVPGADSYTLQVSTSSTFTTSSMIYNVSGFTATSQQVTGLNPNTIYYWRVRSASGSVQGFYSVKFSFTTGTTIGLQDEQPFTVQAIYPNPATEVITVQLYLQKQLNVLMQISDICGRVLINNEYQATSGLNETKTDVSDIAPGIYFVTISADGRETQSRIVIQ